MESKLRCAPSSRHLKFLYAFSIAQSRKFGIKRVYKGQITNVKKWMEFDRPGERSPEKDC